LFVSLYAEKKKEGMTRDVGTQSTPPYLSSSSPSPTSTPSIVERLKTRPVDSPSSNSNAKTKSEEEVCTNFFSINIYFQ